jgi:NADPH2:quinone reductase
MRKATLRKLRRLHAGERGIDLILENVADKNLKKDIGLVRDQGRIVAIGSRTPDAAINVIDAFFHEIVVKGLSLFKITDEEIFETRESLYAGVKAGWLNPFIWKEFPLEKAADAHALLKSGSGARGKIILTLN